MKRAAIVDPNYDGFAIIQVSDLEVGGEGQVLMGGRDPFLIVEFPILGIESVESGSIPGGLALFTILFYAIPDLILPAQYHIVLIANATGEFKTWSGAIET